jgi:hypothetical protein
LLCCSSSSWGHINQTAVAGYQTAVAGYLTAVVGYLTAVAGYQTAVAGYQTACTLCNEPQWQVSKLCGRSPNCAIGHQTARQVTKLRARSAMSCSGRSPNCARSIVQTSPNFHHDNGAYCTFAMQPCPAALPGSLARQPCPAALPAALPLQFGILPLQFGTLPRSTYNAGLSFALLFFFFFLGTH